VKPVDIEEMLKTIQQKFDSRYLPSMPEPAATHDVKYPWQKAVLAAFLEFRPDFLPLKLNAAEACDFYPTSRSEED
jgi:hypothetical protein